MLNLKLFSRYIFNTLIILSTFLYHICAHPGELKKVLDSLELESWQIKVWEPNTDL